MGNAIGETMACLMIVGNVSSPAITFSITQPTNLIPAIIAASASGEAAPGTMYFSGLYGLGLILFVIIAVLNLVIRAFLRKGITSGNPRRER
jgi:ABC-type phosphate transport system permease subunit